MSDNIHTLIKFDRKEDYDWFREKYFSVDEDGFRFFDLEKVIPIPKHPSAAHKVYNLKIDDPCTRRERGPGAGLGIEGDFDWFSWGARHWLTKWNTYENREDDEKLEIWFQTAWSSPYPVIDTIIQLNPGLGKRIHGYDICEYNGYNKFNEWKTDQDYLEVITHDLEAIKEKEGLLNADVALANHFPIGRYMIEERHGEDYFEEMLNYDPNND